jgi:NADH-quinone oxidoreductase subunit J
VTPANIVLLVATLLLAAALWLLLPRGGSGRWWKLRIGLGAGLGLASLMALGWQVPQIGPLGEHALFLVLAGVTIISAAATVTLRNPVYAALWFALTLMGTSGLFLATGAQFLGVATIVVYAGAILVTFLFVLMLANPRGQAYYDRLSWEALLSAGAGTAMVGMLAAAVGGALTKPPVPSQPDGNVLTDQHMAALGAQLFSRHLIAVEVAGTLLLVALVGAVVITASRKPAAPQEAPTSAARPTSRGNRPTETIAV